MAEISKVRFGGVDYDIKSITDTTLSEAGTPADAEVAGRENQALYSAISENHNRTANGIFTPALEVGSINFANNTISWGNYKYRVRTKKDIVYALNPGDVIGLSNYNNAHFMAYWKDSNGNWSNSGWKTNDFTVPAVGEYAIMLAKVSEDTTEILPNPEAIGFTVYITDNNSTHSAISTLGDRIDTLSLALNIEDTVDNNFILRSGRLYNYCGLFLAGGTLVITSIPSNTRVGLQGFSDSAYKTKVSDSGWITSAPREITVNPNLYYMVMIANFDYSAITDVSTAEQFIMNHRYNLADKVSSLEKETNKNFAAHMKIQSETVKSIAHRGDFATAPQCTKPAYILARRNGFKYAENDVNITSDNQYVMWHDTNFSRLGMLVDVNGYDVYTDGAVFYYYNSSEETLYTFDTDYIESAVSVSGLTRCNGENYSTNTLTLNQLKRIDFGAYKGEEYSGTTILTFAEWILLCKQLGMEAYIDSKISYTAERVSELVSIVKRLGMLDKVTWININTTTVADYIRAIDSNARLGTLAHPTSELVNAFTSYNTGRGFFFDGNAKTITQNDVILGLDAGFDVEAYYVEYVDQTEQKTLSRITEFVNMGVTGLTLDAYRVEDAFQYMLE